MVSMMGRSDSESQNRYCSAATVKQDKLAMDQLDQFCRDRFLFDLEAMNSGLNSSLMNISTGLIVGPEVNINQVKELGFQVLSDMKEFTPSTFKYVRSCMVKQLPDKEQVSPDLDVTARPEVNTDLMFQRLVTLGELEQKDALSHVPSSLFTTTGHMRPNTKSQVARYLLKVNTPSTSTSDECRGLDLVLDGGMLLHSLTHPWKKGCTYGKIASEYVDYIHGLKESGSHPSVTVVFDGYLYSTTKDHAHKSRTPVRSLQIDIRRETVFNSKKEIFLSNPLNKQRFVNMLACELGDRSVAGVVRCEEDADLEIARAGLSVAGSKPVVVTADDADVTVLLIHYISQNVNRNLQTVYLKRQGKIYNLNDIVSGIDPLQKDSILLSHAFMGCDTTSALYRKGQLKLIKSDLTTFRQVFYNSESDRASIVGAGEEIMKIIYSTKSSRNETLDKIRHSMYCKKLVASKKKVEVATLPPTTEACSHHSLRVFHQVQSWRGNELDPTSYGWERHSPEGLLHPVVSQKAPAPNFLMKLDVCRCAGGAKTSDAYA